MRLDKRLSVQRIYSSKINRFAIPLINVAFIIRSISRYLHEGYYCEALNRLPLFVLLAIVSINVARCLCKRHEVSQRIIEHMPSSLTNFYKEELFLLLGWHLISFIGFCSSMVVDRFITLYGGALFMIFVISSVLKYIYVSVRKKSIK